MLKRDIKINYGTLNKVVYQLGRYDKALGTMSGSVASIENILAEGKGDSIKALVEKAKELEKKIAGVQKEITDVSTILKNYVSDMTAIISPVSEDKMMEVDRNDIYWNKEAINSACL